MTVSVIIPTYMEASCIERCIASAKAQDAKPPVVEVLVADARSTDGTQKLAERKGARVIDVVERGISRGRNAGAAAARGDILLFVDADAVLAPDVVRQLQASFADPEVACVTALAVPADGAWWQRLVYRGTYGLVRFFHAFGVELYPGICVAYRREPFRLLGGFREDFGVVEDLDLSRRCSRIGKCLVNTKAVAMVSTRRLQRHALSVILFHIVNDLRYLLTGRAAQTYPKSEEVAKWSDVWTARK